MPFLASFVFISQDTWISHVCMPFAGTKRTQNTFRPLDHMQKERSKANGRNFARVTAPYFCCLYSLSLFTCQYICHTIASLGQMRPRASLQPCQERGPDLNSKRIQDPGADYRSHVRSLRRTVAIQGATIVYQICVCAFLPRAPVIFRWLGSRL